MNFAWRKILLGLAALLILFALLVIEEHVRGRIALSREMARVHAQGDTLSIAELTPPLPLPSENGAADFLAAANFLGSGSVVPYNLPYGKSGLPGKVRPATQSREWVITQGRTTNHFTAEQLAQDIKQARPQLEAIREAVHRPALRFPIAYSLVNFALLPHLAPSKQASQWLRAASLSALFAGDREEAVADLESLALLSRKQTEEPLMVSQLVGIAEASIGITATWDALQLPGWNDAQLAGLQAAWTGPNHVERMAKSFAMERAMGHELFEHLTPTSLDALNSGFIGGSPSSGLPSLPKNADELLDFIDGLMQATGQALRRFVAQPLWYAAWSAQDHTHLLREWRNAIEMARQVARVHSLRVAKKYLSGDTDEQIDNSPLNRVRFLISSALIGSMQRAIIRASTADTHCQLAVTAIALQRYQLRYGHQAPSLKDLVPEFLPEVPIDPMDGQPLRYRLHDDGTFLLYSVGEDGVDDGGNPNRAEGDRWVSPLYGRDEVWPMPASAEEIKQAEEAARKRSGRGR